MKHLLLLFSLTFFLSAKDYSQHTAVKTFIKTMVKKHHLKEKELVKLFKNIRFQKKALGIFNPKYREKPKKSKKKSSWAKHGAWTRYSKYLLTKTKTQQGLAYMRKHQKVLKKVYKTYGVPPEYIVAIIGIESRYGEKRGTYPILDTLTTLAFEKNRRSAYFKKELESFLLLARSQKIDPRKVKGSYAGAIGLGQFMPSTYAPFAVDFNGDGIKSMQEDSDAIASIANYLKKNGWKQWQPVAEPVSFKGKRYFKHKTGYCHAYPQSKLKNLKIKYGPWSYKEPVRIIKLDRYKHDELWFGAHNFYVITRYNHSNYYAMAVHQLAQSINRAYKKKHGAILR